MKKKRVGKEYKDFVDTAEYNNANFPIPSSLPQNINYCKKMIKGKKLLFKIEEMSFIIGDKYCYYAFNNKTKEGTLNFDDKDIWEDLVICYNKYVKL